MVLGHTSFKETRMATRQSSQHSNRDLHRNGSTPNVMGAAVNKTVSLIVVSMHWQAHCSVDCSTPGIGRHF